MTTIPRSPGPIPLKSQVGGHPGVMTSEDGSLVIKPALPVEVAFYQAVLADPSLESIRPYVPRFFGTLRLEGQVDEERSAQGPAQSIVLENLSYGFAKPNILDIKLGTTLYDEDASDEKRARMEKKARETTSLETGVRLTGFQIYDLEKNNPVITPKSYGYSIKPADLPDGIAKFFIAAAPQRDSGAAPAHPADPAAGAGTTQGTGLPADVLLPVLSGLREDVAEIRNALSGVHMRMVASSLLIIYEADPERAREGVRIWLEEGTKKVGPPYAIKIIDFAHTRLKPGEGPDESLLKGLDTVLRLLDGRIEQVRAL
ncbi:uncharacterized protein PHACADRAFT_145233 [Phanerochaete carnosa HHB-10118-sp]|uniref:Kinase n=1 Tax=Phanerochaete carnosa (strain HHB-10118-sp) TaxID=650164 RepID=K5WA67_PHACS|nr:uncharacterized protein PHACADRAFT_145233 [Phanerochaete carnosa HHB-10118-sp]EKM56120.1 hypothetical protein PHACADRAFT_145233 [Phanerochaete carnosa HHB-10118-sp]